MTDAALDWDAELMTEDGREVHYVGAIPERWASAWRHVVIVGSKGDLSYATTAGTCIKVAASDPVAVRIVNRPPAPKMLQREGWVVGAPAWFGDSDRDGPAKALACKSRFWDDRELAEAYAASQTPPLTVAHVTWSEPEPAPAEPAPPPLPWLGIVRRSGVQQPVSYFRTRENAVAHLRKCLGAPGITAFVARLEPVAADPCDAPTADEHIAEGD